MASDRMMEYYYHMGQDALHREDLDEAVAYFRKAANLGAHEAAHEICVIAHRLETGDRTEKDEERASRYYRLSADFGIMEANLLLGKLYLRGMNGNRPHPRKAKRALEKASDGGNLEATILLAKIYDEGLTGHVLPGKAFTYYLLAAERGDTSSMLMTGLFYAEGTTVEKDLEKAERWIRKGVSLGDADGKNTLRRFLSIAAAEYVNGSRGSVDHDKAWAMAKEADELGDRDAFFRLGKAYQGSTQTTLHAEKAFLCFKKAAEKNLPAAWSQLGLCYDAGLGTEADPNEAAKYYKKAAEAADPFGMTHYGCALATGQGVQQNKTEAMSWLIKAAMAGDQGALLILREDFGYELQ